MTDSHAALAPPWLSALQRDWSALLRSPLDSSSGTFAERRESYPLALRAAICAPKASGTTTASIDDRLALYHLQYWMRLFTTLQGRFPRFSRAIGYWHFNHLAALHLKERPPQHFDIDRVGDGFDARVGRALSLLGRHATKRRDPWVSRLRMSRAPEGLLEEALCIDGQERLTFEAPLESEWKPTSAQLEALAGLRVRVAASVQIVTERWELVRHSSLAGGASPPIDGPPRRLPEPRHWVLHRTESGVASVQVPRALAHLLHLASAIPFGQALAELERTTTAADLSLVRAELSSWVRMALEQRWWVGAK